MLCKRCGRKLKNVKAVECGYGSVCKEKVKFDKKVKTLEEWFV
jgi:ribosomal protein L37E